MMNHERQKRRRRLSAILAGLFLLALVMGAGPGLYLINPDESHPGRTLFGAPIVYAWAVIWFAVQAIVVVIAYVTVCREESS